MAIHIRRREFIFPWAEQQLRGRWRAAHSSRATADHRKSGVQPLMRRQRFARSQRSAKSLGETVET